MKTLTIGQLAGRAEVNVETIRFYERTGLIPQPPRRESGYRQYPESAVSLVRFIRHAQELGFFLREIKELLDLRVDSAMTCRDVRHRAEAKLADVERKIASLREIRTELTKIIGSCCTERPVAECAILNSFDRDSQET